jgi:GT2 family glycosyltransferase
MPLGVSRRYLTEYGMKSDRSISAVVISYNGTRFLGECLETLKSDLSGYDHEIIVIENGSTDGSVELIERGFPNVILIKNRKNLGFAKAVNQGIVAARKSFLWLLNQDIRIRKGALDALLDFHSGAENPGVVGPRYVGFDGTLQWSARRFPRYRFLYAETFGLSRLFPKSPLWNGWKMGDFDHLISCEVDQPMGAAMLVERNRIDQIGMLDESFGIFFNDVDFCRRLKDAGYHNYYCAEAVIEHFVGGSVSRAKPTMIWKSHFSMFRYFAKYEQSRKGSSLTRLIRFPLPYIAAVFLIASAIPRSLYHLIKKII